jgi:hypothetical protein
MMDDQLSATLPCAYLNALFSPSLAYVLAVLPPAGITATFLLLVFVGAAKSTLCMRLDTFILSLAAHQGTSSPFLQLFKKLWDAPFSQISNSSHVVQALALIAVYLPVFNHSLFGK